LTGLFRIGNAMAYVMFDSRCGTDIVSLDFARATGVRPIPLERPIALQMALVGSRGRVGHGITLPIEVGSVVRPHYFDIANIDRYDAILGTPFFHQTGARLDFKRREIVV
ncbi:hypothetical protein BDV93DRAFT_413167, partial [Ceratobasidium sp. AG-I]